jgi:catechol 2,3-dioxygenase-like lactoylglutathione lyase family enzyme
MAVSSIEVVSIPVSDQDRAKEFYAGKLGFTVRMDSAFGEGMRWVMLQLPGGGTSITLVTWFDSMPAGSLKGAVLGCDDLEKTLDELTARGVTFNEEQIEEAPWGRWKTLDDPDGNTWVLQQNNPGFAR